MTLNRLDRDNFDEILVRAVKRHSELVPADFIERMMRRIEEAQEQRILARVVLQERLALAGCIVLAAAVIVLAMVFSGPVTAVFRSIAINLTEWGHAFIEETPRTIRAVRGDLQFYTVFVGVLGFTVYSLVDLLTANDE